MSSRTLQCIYSRYTITRGFPPHGLAEAEPAGDVLKKENAAYLYLCSVWFQKRITFMEVHCIPANSADYM